MNYEQMVRIHGTEGAKDKMKCGYTGIWNDALNRCLKPTYTKSQKSYMDVKNKPAPTPAPEAPKQAEAKGKAQAVIAKSQGL